MADGSKAAGPPKVGGAAGAGDAQARLGRRVFRLVCEHCGAAFEAERVGFLPTSSKRPKIYRSLMGASRVACPGCGRAVTRPMSRAAWWFLAAWLAVVLVYWAVRLALGEPAGLVPLVLMGYIGVSMVMARSMRRRGRVALSELGTSG